MHRYLAFLISLATASTVGAQAPADANQPSKNAGKKLTVGIIEIKGHYSESPEGGGIFSEVVETLTDALNA